MVGQWGSRKKAPKIRGLGQGKRRVEPSIFWNVPPHLGFNHCKGQGEGYHMNLKHCLITSSRKGRLIIHTP